MITTNIMHPGVNFWKRLILTKPSDYFGAGNTLFLCLNAEGLLLHHFFLTRDAISSNFFIQACVTLAKGVGTSTLVRIQAHQDYKTALSTEVLYKTAHLYGLHLVEVIPLRFTQ